MHDQHSLLTRLLATAQAAPTAERWALLCATLDVAPPALLPGAVEALEEALAPWPAALRPLPRRWLRPLLRGHESPAARLARALTWRELPFSAEDLRLALQHPALRQLRELAFDLPPWGKRAPAPGGRLGALGLHALLHAPQRDALEGLHLSGAELDAAAFTALIAWEGFGGLRRLSLHRPPLDHLAVEALAARAMPALRELTLGYTDPWPHPPDEATLGLLRLPQLGALERLTLDNVHCSPAALEGLAALLTPSLQELRLTLRRYAFEPNAPTGALTTLLTSPWRTGLRTLALSCVPLRDQASTLLLDGPPMPALSALSLDRLGLNEDTAAQLAAWPALAQLEHLSVNEDTLLPRALERLVARSDLHSLHALRWPAVASPKALEDLAALPMLSDLECDLYDERESASEAFAALLGRLQKLKPYALGWRDGQPDDLLTHPALTRVEALTLWRPDPALLHTLQTAPLRQTLRTLHIQCTDATLTWELLEALLSPETLPALQSATLNLAHANLKPLKRRERPLREAAIARGLALQLWSGDEEDAACAELLRPSKQAAPNRKEPPKPEPDAHQGLEDLRDLLYGEPNAAAWARLCARLDEPHPDAALRLAYATPLIDARWPDEARTLPPVQARRAAAGDAPTPATALCRAYDDHGLALAHDWYPTAFLNNPALTGLHQLELGPELPAPRVLDALAQAPWLPTLTTLKIDASASTPQYVEHLVAVLATWPLPALATKTCP